MADVVADGDPADVVADGDPAADLTGLDAEVRRIQLAVIQLVRQLRVGDPSDLSRADFSALAVVSKYGPLRAGQLAAHEGVDPASMSRTVKTLLQKGYVRRKADASDGRAALIVITPNGRRRFEELRAATTAFLVARLDRLTDEERRSLLTLGPSLEALVRITRT